jgi:hypothetical protein
MTMGRRIRTFGTSLFTLLVLVAMALVLTHLAACSTQTFDQFLRNVSAAGCANPAATLANAPIGVLTPGQAQEALAGFCAGEFGTIAAPTPAPGMAPAIPAATSPTPAPAAAAPAPAKGS